jgi:arylsulfatase A-like enzyme
LIFVAPKVTKPGTRCDRPVDFLALYPTLADLCGLKAPGGLDGVSLMPLLRDPSVNWDRPALTTWGRGNHVLHADRFSYIRYAGGGEELYDHLADPNEWKNLAKNAELEKAKSDLSRWFPAKEVPAPTQEELAKNRAKVDEKAKAKGKKTKAVNPDED